MSRWIIMHPASSAPCKISSARHRWRRTVRSTSLNVACGLRYHAVRSTGICPGGLGKEWLKMDENGYNSSGQGHADLQR